MCQRFRAKKRKHSNKKRSKKSYKVFIHKENFKYNSRKYKIKNQISTLKYTIKYSKGRINGIA